MENTFGGKVAFTENIPSNNKVGLSPQNVEAPLNSHSPELKNPFVIPGIKNLQIEVKKKSDLEDSFNQEIEELSQETENLVSEIEKWQM